MSDLQKQEEFPFNMEDVDFKYLQMVLQQADNPLLVP